MPISGSARGALYDDRMTVDPTPQIRSATSSATRRGGASRNGAILVTGAGGEMGHGLLESLAAEKAAALDAGESFPAIVAIDLRDLPASHAELCDDCFTGDVCDAGLLERMLSSFEVGEIYHLAALLSTRSEFVPETAHSVNVDGVGRLGDELRTRREQRREVVDLPDLEGREHPLEETGVADVAREAVVAELGVRGGEIAQVDRDDGWKRLAGVEGCGLLGRQRLEEPVPHLAPGTGDEDGAVPGCPAPAGRRRGRGADLGRGVDSHPVIVQRPPCRPGNRHGGRW